MSGPPVIGAPVPALDPGSAAAVAALAAAATEVDGVAPLNEAGLMALSAPVLHRSHRLVRDRAGALIGYAGIDSAGTPATAELVVAPANRRAGVGRALVAELRTHEPGPALWSHGDLPAARALARTAHLTPGRRLARLRRPAGPPPPPRDPPAGVVIDSFRPDRDEAAWLRVNAAAFAGHPEQGRWSAPELRSRMGESWFDPFGLLMAWRVGGPDPVLVGFDWTKLSQPIGNLPAVGEVYVLAVDPGAQAAGLGTALAVAGLRSLVQRGAGPIVLWVEADSPAVRLYRRLGFLDDALDVLYF